LIKLFNDLHLPPLFRYDALKKQIYQLEKQQHGIDRSTYDLESNERTSLMGRGGAESSSDEVFIPLLDHELKKITIFYETQEKELLEEVTGLEELAIQQEEAGLAAGHDYDEETDDDDDDDDEPISPEGSRRPRRTRPKSFSFSGTRKRAGSSFIFPFHLKRDAWNH
jgi:phosphate transporter